MDRPGPSTSRRAFLAAGTVTFSLAAAPSVTSTSTPAAANGPSSGWTTTYGGRGEQWFTAAAPAHDGGWLAVGTDLTAGRPLAVSVSTTGRTRWSRRYDVESDGLTDVVGTADGYVVSGRQGYVAWLDPEGRVRSSVDVHEDDPLRPTMLVPLDDGFVLGGVAPTPESASTVLVGLADDGTVRWRQVYETEFSLAFLEPWQGGIIAGGWHLEPDGPWLASLGPDGTERAFEIRSHPDWATPADAVRAHGGLTLLGDGGLLHLDADRSVAWRRDYDPLAHCHPHALARTLDGGYLIAGLEDDTTFVRLAAIAADRTLRWTGRYGETSSEVDPGFAVGDVLATGRNAALVVGTRRKGHREAWAGLLGPADVSTPTTTPATTLPPTSPPPTTVDPEASPDGTDRTTVGVTTTASRGQPGFGVIEALAGLAGVGAWRVLRGE